MYQIYKDLHIDRNTHQRGLVSMGPYIPVFCAELACYLNEASWQAYYSPQSLPGFKDKNDFYGWMKLGTIGLRLEGYIFNERTNTQAYVATNSAPQIEGEEDSVIVVAFRGTSNTTNMQIDLRMNQVGRCLSAAFEQFKTPAVFVRFVLMMDCIASLYFYF